MTKKIEPFKINPLKKFRAGDRFEFVDYSAARHFVGIYDSGDKRIHGGLETSISLVTDKREEFAEVDLSKVLRDKHPYRVAIINRDIRFTPTNLDNTAIVAIWDISKNRRIYSIDSDRSF